MFPIIDLHCHPSLKIYLCNKDISRKHYPLPDVLPSGMHVDLPGMKQANVQVAFVSHYIPEAGFGHLEKSRWLFRLLKKIGLNIIEKFEPDTENDGAFYRAVTSISLLEHQITKAEKRFSVIIPKNYTEFKSGYEAGKMIILHSLEGGHHLGKHLAKPEDYLLRLADYKQQGVCLLTIAHFFTNALCDSGGGIPPSVAKKIGYSKPPSTCGLCPIGRLVVNWCQEHGVIIDLVHSTVETRNQVYELIRDRSKKGLKTRPVIFSHSGVREIAGPNMKNQDDKFILPDIAELKSIRECRGVIALILMNYWVIGIEEDNILKKEAGIEHLLHTIECINNALGDFENIAIGTDLDGFTQVPDDITHVRRIGRLRNAIIKRFGEAAAKKICYQNALRVLEEGWG